MCSHQAAPFVWSFFQQLFPYLCRRSTKALLRLRGCAGSSEPSLFAFVASTIFTWADSNVNETHPDIWAASWQNQQMIVHPAKTLIRVFAVRMKKPWALSYPLSAIEDSDQTGQMPRLIWVFAGCTVILLVLSWGGSFCIKNARTERGMSKDIKSFLY